MNQSTSCVNRKNGKYVILQKLLSLEQENYLMPNMEKQIHIDETIRYDLKQCMGRMRKQNWVQKFGWQTCTRAVSSKFKC